MQAHRVLRVLSAAIKDAFDDERRASNLCTKEIGGQMKPMANLASLLGSPGTFRAAAIQGLELVQSLARKARVCGRTLAEKVPSVLLQGLWFLLGLVLLLL